MQDVGLVCPLSTSHVLPAVLDMREQRMPSMSGYFDFCDEITYGIWIHSHLRHETCETCETQINLLPPSLPLSHGPPSLVPPNPIFLLFFASELMISPNRAGFDGGEGGAGGTASHRIVVPSVRRAAALKKVSPTPSVRP